MDEALLALVEASLALWACPGTVRRDASGCIVVDAAGHSARIARAAPDAPFRWSVTVDGRQRVAGSVTGLLRALRMRLDPKFRPSRARIVPIGIGSP